MTGSGTEVEVGHDDHRWTVRLGRGVAASEMAGALASIRGRGGPEPVQVWVVEPGPEHAEAATTLGLTPGRDLCRLVRPLPADPPPPVRLRAFEPDTDTDAWLAVNNRAFAGHPEQGGWRAADLAARRSERWYDPAGFLVHHDEGGNLDGFVWTKVHPATVDAHSVGEIYVIAVDPAAHRRGLGRALVLAGLDDLHRRRGLHQAMLYTDAGNAPARALYAALGFTLDHVERSFEGTVERER